MAKRRNDTINSFAGMFGNSDMNTNISAAVVPAAEEDNIKKEQPIIKRGRPKTNAETKIVKSIAIYPSVVEELKKIALVNRKSESEVVAELITEYYNKNKERIDNIFSFFENN